MTEMPVRVGVNFDGFVTTGEAIALRATRGRRGSKKPLGRGTSRLSRSHRDLHGIRPESAGPHTRSDRREPLFVASDADRDGDGDARRGRARPRRDRGFRRGQSPVPPEESGRAVEQAGARHDGEFTEALRKLWAGEAVHVDGEFVTLAGARLAFKPSAPIPIYIAAMGPDMLRLAGRIGDGVVLSAGLSTATVQASIALCAEGAGPGRTRSRRVPPRRISVLRRLALTPGRPSTRSGKSSHS